MAASETEPRRRILVVPAGEHLVAHLRVVDWPANLLTNSRLVTELVGGDLDAVELGDVRCYVDGNSYDRKARNDAATVIVDAIRGPRRTFMGRDYVSGTAVFFGTRDESGRRDEENYDVPDSLVEQCRRLGIEVIEEPAASGPSPNA